MRLFSLFLVVFAMMILCIVADPTQQQQQQPLSVGVEPADLMNNAEFEMMQGRRARSRSPRVRPVRSEMEMDNDGDDGESLRLTMVTGLRRLLERGSGLSRRQRTAFRGMLRRMFNSRAFRRDLAAYARMMGSEMGDDEDRMLARGGGGGGAGRGRTSRSPTRSRSRSRSRSRPRRGSRVMTAEEVEQEQEAMYLDQLENSDFDTNADADFEEASL